MSSQTRHALKVIHDYRAGENEAVSDRFLFVSEAPTSGFYLLSTTNI